MLHRPNHPLFAHKLSHFFFMCAPMCLCFDFIAAEAFKVLAPLEASPYSARSTAVLRWKYSSTSGGVLEYFERSTEAMT